MRPPGGQDDWRRKHGTASREHSAQSAASSVPTRTPRQAVKGETTLRRPLPAVKDGVTCGGEVLQAVGEGGPLPGGECREPEAAPGHEVGVAPELASAADDGAPDCCRSSKSV